MWPMQSVQNQNQSEAISPVALAAAARLPEEAAAAENHEKDTHALSTFTLKRASSTFI